jgi:hypothetical protein
MSMTPVTYVYGLNTLKGGETESTYYLLFTMFISLQRHTRFLKLMAMPLNGAGGMFF